MGCDPDISASVLGFGEDGVEATWTDSLLHPASQVRQVAYAGSAVGSEDPVGRASEDLSDLVQISEDPAKDLHWWILTAVG